MCNTMSHYGSARQEEVKFFSRHTLGSRKRKIYFWVIIVTFKISAMCKFSSVTVPDSGVTGVSRLRWRWMEELIRFKSQNTEWFRRIVVTQSQINAGLFFTRVFLDRPGGKWVSERRNASLQDQEEISTRIREKVLKSVFTCYSKSGWENHLIILFF